MHEQSIEALGLTNGSSERAYDNIVSLAARTLDAPVALVSIVYFEQERQYFKSQLGLSEPWASAHETPLSHSFCRHVVSEAANLCIADAREHSELKRNPAIVELGVVAYLGTPVRTPLDIPVGALCVIDVKPHKWSDNDVDTLESLALCVADVICVRAALNASEALRAEQREFSYALSHDLRSPIDSLKVLLEELVRGDMSSLNSVDRQLIALGQRTADRAVTLIDDVVDYTHSIERDFQRESVSLDEIVAAVRENLTAEIARTKAEFDIARLPCVEGNPMQLQMLMQNLIGNALKYNRPVVAPRITIRQHGESGAQFSVADIGIGIEPAHQERVFELFRRVQLSDQSPGSGLGLAVCRRVVSNHAGKIKLSSVPGEGPTFTVTLRKAA